MTAEATHTVKPSGSSDSSPYLTFSGDYLDRFGAHAENYKTSVELISIIGCRRLVDLVNGILPLSQEGSYAFDDGCGTGATTTWLKKKAPELRVLAPDQSMGMVEAVTKLGESQGWTNFETKVLDAVNLAGIPDNYFTHGFFTYVLPFMPEGERALEELHRVIKPGGVLGVATWGNTHFHLKEPWEYATSQIVPGYEMPGMIVPRWTKCDSVQASIERAGFSNVQVEEDKLPWSWDSLDHLAHFWEHSGHPGPVRAQTHFENTTGRKREEALPHWRRWLTEKYGEGPIVLPIESILMTARK